MKIVAIIQWIHNDCGGRETSLKKGERMCIRWQKYFDEPLNRVVEITKYEVGVKLNIVTAEFLFISKIPIHPLQLKKGELIELLDEYAVIGIGKIIDNYE